MEESILGIPDIDVYLVLGILLFFIVLETIGGYLHNSKRSFSDWVQEAGSYAILGLLIKPGIVFFILYIGHSFPNLQYSLHHYNFWGLLIFYLFVDDFLQYWYHRSAHEYPFLWKLHRSHHQAEEMGFFVSYRNAFLYYVLMPNIWWIGIFTFLGGAKAVALGLILKQLIIISSHSRVSYDKFFYRHQWFHPFISVWERIFITPAFHHAHHGKSKSDGISDPNSNFGNMFSIWDQLFGTAQFTREFPKAYGLQNDQKEHWATAYFYPVLASDNPDSELHRKHKKTPTTTLEPTLIHLEKDKKYLWCQCGLSKNQPFCDGSHHGTKHKPLLFTAKKTGNAKLCNCKLTKLGPFCDNSHIV